MKKKSKGLIGIGNDEIILSVRRIKRLKTYSEQEIYKFVSNFYKNKDLQPSEFSNRLYAIKRIVSHENSMRDVIRFLDIREHWWEFEKDDRARLKSKTRNQFKTILKSMKLELAKEGLKALE